MSRRLIGGVLWVCGVAYALLTFHPASSLNTGRLNAPVDKDRLSWSPTIIQPRGYFLSLPPSRPTPSFPLPVFAQDVSVTTGLPSNEPAIAADPTRPQYFIAAGNSLHGVGHWVTTDGGLTWVGGEFTNGDCCDASAVYDGAGRAYITMLRFPTQANCPDAISLGKSTDGGVTWSTAQTILTSPNADTAYDKPWLAADTYPASPHYGRLYVTFTSFYAPGCAVYTPQRADTKISWSDDQGQTWSAPVTINDAAHDQNNFTHLTIASDGTVYVTDQFQACTDQCNAVPAYNLLHWSNDGGVSWSPAITVTGQPISYTGVFTDSHLQLQGTSTTTSFRHNDQPIVGVSPTISNHLYLIWTDGRWDSSFTFQGLTGKHADIAFSRSTDGGVTWSSPIRINDDSIGNGKDQFFPWMAVGNDGTIHVTWLDRRDTVDGFGYRAYYTQSDDGGLTWSM